MSDSLFMRELSLRLLGPCACLNPSFTCHVLSCQRPVMCPVSFEIHPCHLSLSLRTLITLIFIYFFKTTNIIIFIFTVVSGLNFVTSTYGAILWQCFHSIAKDLYLSIYSLHVVHEFERDCETFWTWRLKDHYFFWPVLM